MIIVKKRKGESDESYVNRARAVFKEEGIVEDFRERVRFVKPSQKRKKQKYAVAHKIELEKKRNQ